jgi:hypothetical protein
MEYVYFKSGNDLGVADATTGRLVSLGYLEGYMVRSVEQLPSENACIVLLNGDEGLGARERRFRNLCYYAHERGTIWHAELPTTSGVDHYVSFSVNGGQLFGNSWSAYYVELDVASGKIQAKTFTK